MKYILIFLICVFWGEELFAQQPKRSELQTKSSLGIRYYNAREYEKAMPLLKDVYAITHSSSYFRYYVNCLVELERYDEAEKEIKKELKKNKQAAPGFYVHWGEVLKRKQLGAEAEEKFNQALALVPANRTSYFMLANDFMGWQEFEWAKKVYLQGREKVPGEDFTYELARTYYYLRDYKNMMEEYLNLLRSDAKNLQRVQSALSSALRMDIDDELHEMFRGQVLQRIQKEPQVIGYNRLLVWFLLQENKFESALRQLIALDKRTGEEASEIARLGDMAILHKEYEGAYKAFRYLLDQGPDTPFYRQAYISNLHASYLKFTNRNGNDREAGEQLTERFRKGLEVLGLGQQTLSLAREYAHLLAFYLDRPKEAIAVLEKALELPRLKPEEKGELKTELADVYVYADDPWEAMLLYSQVIEANKTNSLGDDVKLKKARLGYYMGNFSWARAQLDVLKASTSKLTANDAMALSMLISENLDLDTTAVPLQLFARADWLFFRNKYTEALAVLDSLMEAYPYNSLVDDILFRKAKVEKEQGNYEMAAAYLNRIVNDFSYELTADDALFLLAEIEQHHLMNEAKARDLYRQILTDYPGSVFVEEARARYRELRKMYPDEQEELAPQENAAGEAGQ